MKKVALIDQIDGKKDDLDGWTVWALQTGRLVPSRFFAVKRISRCILELKLT
jgi:hypothetical protein